MKKLLILFTFTLLQLSCSNLDSTNEVEAKKVVAQTEITKTTPTTTIQNLTSPIKDAKFSFNEEIANYRFEWNRNSVYSFVDTEKPTEIVEAYNSMAFQEMEEMNLEKRTSLFWFWIDSMSQGKKRVFSNNDLHQIKIGVYDALVYDSDYMKDGKKGAVYMALLSKGDQAIKFTGTAYGNVEKAREQFKATAASIKIK